MLWGLHHPGTGGNPSHIQMGLSTPAFLDIIVTHGLSHFFLLVISVLKEYIHHSHVLLLSMSWFLINVYIDVLFESFSQWPGLFL